MTAAHCEAKLHGFRKTQDGIVVSFVLHPQDWPQQLALDPLGTRYMLAVAQIGDDEQPVSAAATPTAANAAPTMPLYGCEPLNGPERATEENRKAALVPTIVKRAGILGADIRFANWVARKMGERYLGKGLRDATVDPIEFIRAECGVSSRRELAKNPAARELFYQLLDRYLAETGQRAEMRG